MTHPGNPIARALDLGLIAGAWLFVPAGERMEWWREWRAELWQARHEHACDGRVTWPSERALFSFCLGAYQDALCLRRLERRTRPAHRVRFGAAWQCVLLLVILLGASYALSRVLPGVRAQQKLARVSTRPGLVLIQDVNNEDSPATISSGQYRAWKDRKQEFFDDFAFYRVTRENVRWPQHDDSGWGVARASSNFFSLVGLPVQPVSAESRIVLSESAWRKEFGANPDIAGSEVLLGSRRVTIVGVVPDGAWLSMWDTDSRRSARAVRCTCSW